MTLRFELRVRQSFRGREGAKTGAARFMGLWQRVALKNQNIFVYNIVSNRETHCSTCPFPCESEKDILRGKQSAQDP